VWDEPHRVRTCYTGAWRAPETACAFWTPATTTSVGTARLILSNACPATTANEVAACGLCDSGNAATLISRKLAERGLVVHERRSPIDNGAT
jgi:hypothetical protein